MRFVWPLLLLLSACGGRGVTEPPAAFVEAAKQTGLDFQHFTGATGKYYLPEIMGSGCALLDYDNDGDLDVFFVQATSLDDPERGPGNRFYRNELIPSGELQFTDVTAHSGLGKVMYGMGAASGDFDNDGLVDLYVTAFGPNALYRNRGGGTFDEITETSGTQDERFSTGAAFLDYDRDGLLDLFVLNYVDFTVEGNKRCTAASGEMDYCTPKAYQPVPDRLFRNEGGGRFRDVTAEAGVDQAYGPGLGIVANDFNGDGWIDVYIANDTRANLLWLNRGGGGFSEVALVAGAAYAETGFPRAGMGVGAGDFDNDGDDDLVVLNLTGEGATLFRHEGVHDGVPRFFDVTVPSGLRAPTLPHTGFGCDWIDFDNDGRLDLFAANGAAMIMPSLRGQAWPFHQPNQLFRNAGDGRFEDWSAKAGPAFDARETSRGAAFGDIDNDGDIDILVTNSNGPARLLLNQIEGRSLQVELEGASGNNAALGARVGLFLDDGQVLWRRAHVDSSYLSASDPRVHFGLGRGRRPVKVEVRWADGSRERWELSPRQQRLRLRHGTGRP